MCKVSLTKTTAETTTEWCASLSALRWQKKEKKRKKSPGVHWACSGWWPRQAALNDLQQLLCRRKGFSCKVKPAFGSLFTPVLKTCGRWGFYCPVLILTEFRKANCPGKSTHLVSKKRVANVKELLFQIVHSIHRMIWSLWFSISTSVSQSPDVFVRYPKQKNGSLHPCRINPGIHFNLNPIQRKLY